MIPTPATFPSNDDVRAALEFLGVPIPRRPAWPYPPTQDAAFRARCDLARVMERVERLPPEPGPRGPSFDRLWSAFLALFAAEQERDSAPDYPTRQAALRRVSSRGRDFDVAKGLWESAQKPPTPGSRFYASARYHGETSLLAGPYDTHEAALRVVPRAKALALTLDRNAFLYAYGTCALGPHEDHPPGLLAEALAADPGDDAS